MDDMMPHEGNLPTTKADLWSMGAELRMEFRSELAVVRSELGMEIAAVRSDMNTLRSELYAVKTELNDNIQRFAIGILKAFGELSHQMQDHASQMKKDRSEMIGIMDAFLKKGEVYDQKALSHGDMLQDHKSRLIDHEKRIGSIETKH
jgi:hypothetical protein